MAQEQDKERAQPEWWRKRADEIELEVARSGSRVAMRCYTDMRTLLQAATTAAPQPNAALAEAAAWCDERVIGWLAEQRSPLANITTKLSKGKCIERPMPLYIDPQPNAALADGRQPVLLQEIVDRIKAYGDSLYCKAAATSPVDKKSWNRSAENILTGISDQLRAMLPAPPTLNAGKEQQP